MEEPVHRYDRLLGKIVDWARNEPDIGAMIVVGSRARSIQPADEWSDLDLVITATDPERYLTRTDWLGAIGNPQITFIEKTSSADDWERRVLFEGGLDVDFAFISRSKVRLLVRMLRLRERFPLLFRLLPKSAARQVARGLADFSGIARRGIRVLLDRDGFADELQSAAVETPPPRPPDQEAFLDLVHDFWYHAVWAAKKLRRGELWTAKGCSDIYMKWRLLRMVEWHARARQGWDYDTWFEGRFLERWADPRVLEDLRGAFAHYDEEDLWRGLFETMDFFRWVAEETAAQLDYHYPAPADEYATELVQRAHSKEG